MNNQQVTDNIFSLIFYQSEHGGKIRLTSRHPETKEYIFPHRDWETLNGGNKVRAGVSCHCTLERSLGGSKCWIATPCVGMSLSAEAKLLELRAAQLTEREHDLTKKGKLLNERSDNLNALKAQLETISDNLVFAKIELEKEYKKVHQMADAIHPYRNALQSAAKQIEEAKIELLDLVELVEKLNKEIPLEKRLVVNNLLDTINNAKVAVPKLQDCIAQPVKQPISHSDHIFYPFRPQAEAR